MELSKQCITFILCILCISVIAYAVSQKIYVDTVFNKTNIINVTNITMLGKLSGATNISADIFYMSGAKVATLDNITSGKYANSTAYNWSTLTGYPAACPSNTYITQLNDTVTCTGISDIYAFNNGDNLTGNYNFTGNISQGTNRYHTFGNGAPTYIFYNGTALVIKVT